MKTNTDKIVTKKKELVFRKRTKLILILFEFTTPILMSKYPFRATMYNNGPTE